MCTRRIFQLGFHSEAADPRPTDVGLHSLANICVIDDNILLDNNMVDSVDDDIVTAFFCYCCS